MFRCEVPTWQRVLGRMGRYATQPRRLAEAEQQHYLEYPQQVGSQVKLPADLQNAGACLLYVGEHHLLLAGSAHTGCGIRSVVAVAHAVVQ